MTNKEAAAPELQVARRRARTWLISILIVAAAIPALYYLVNFALYMFSPDLLTAEEWRQRESEMIFDLQSSLLGILLDWPIFGYAIAAHRSILKHPGAWRLIRAGVIGGLIGVSLPYVLWWGAFLPRAYISRASDAGEGLLFMLLFDPIVSIPLAILGCLTGRAFAWLRQKLASVQQEPPQTPVG